MTITRTNTGEGLPAGFPFSLAAEASGVCFISGMPALDPDGVFQAGALPFGAKIEIQAVAARGN